MTSYDLDIDRYRRDIATASGPASYLDTGGDGPAVRLRARGRYQ